MCGDDVLCVECSRLEDGRVLLQVGDEWVLALEPAAAALLSRHIASVAAGLDYALCVLTADQAELLAS